MSRPARTVPPPATAAGETRSENEPSFAIGDLAAELGITTRAIRFYETKGLVAPQRRGKVRCYTRRDRARLLLILRGKNLGFSLDDIKQYLELYDADPMQLTQVRLLAQKVNEHMAELERKRADLDRTLAELAEIRAQIAAHLAGSGRG